jgi:hypothetical protein
MSKTPIIRVNINTPGIGPIEREFRAIEKAFHAEVKRRPAARLHMVRALYHRMGESLQRLTEAQLVLAEAYEAGQRGETEANRE